MSVALVAVTVTVEVPVGVPGLGGGGVTPPPPPQAAKPMRIKARMPPPTIWNRRRRRAWNPNASKPMQKIRAVKVFRNVRSERQSLKSLRPMGTTELAAVVVTFNVVVPVPVTVGGVKTHAALAGNPVQENEVAPAKALEPVTVRVAVAN